VDLRLIKSYKTRNKNLINLIISWDFLRTHIFRHHWRLAKTSCLDYKAPPTLRVCNFHSLSVIFRPHHAGEIWKRNNRRSFWICVWRKLGQGNHVIIVTSSFSKNIFRPSENAKPAFSNSSGLTSVFEKLRFRDGLVWTVGLTIKIKCVFKFLRRSVDRAQAFSRNIITQDYSTRKEVKITFHT